MPPPVRAAAAFGISYRAEREQDAPFLAELYASTRTEELAPLGWPPEVLSRFLDQQRLAQRAHYRAVYPGAEWLIVEAGRTPVGRLYLETDASRLHLIDVSLLPQRRGRGLGGAILADLVADAAARGLTASLHVEKTNPARRLYERLGFRIIADNGLHDRMERPPDDLA